MLCGTGNISDLLYLLLTEDLPQCHHYVFQFLAGDEAEMIKLNRRKWTGTGSVLTRHDFITKPCILLDLFEQQDPLFLLLPGGKVFRKQDCSQELHKFKNLDIFILYIVRNNMAGPHSLS